MPQQSRDADTERRGDVTVKVIAGDRWFMEIRIRSCQGVSLITCPLPLLVLLLHHPVPHPLLPYLYILALPVFRDEGRETSHSLLP